MTRTTDEHTSPGRGAGLVRRLRALPERSPLLAHLLVALVGLVVVFVVLESSSEFRNSQFATMAYFGIASGGLTVLTGLNGQLSLGHGALMAFGAYTTAVLLEDQQMPLLAIMLLATLLTTVVGVVVGVPAARLHGPYIAGATLALAVAVPGIALYFSDTLGGEQGLPVIVPDVPSWFFNAIFFLSAHETSTSKYVAYLGWGALILTFVLLANLARSRVGRNWRAVRDDEVAAELAGIHLGRSRVFAFVVSAACAGLAGAVLALVVRIAAPSGFTLTLSLSLLTAVVLGGLGSLAGALIGAALLTFLPQVFTSVGTNAGLSDLQAAELAPFVYGLTLVVVILVAPAGIVGTVRERLQARADPIDDSGVPPALSAAPPSSPAGGTTPGGEK
ncbi:MAG TPA: branched-chain amino acid ABC transporter permease [Nocardioidaceae bacterium]|nr:branched-chain amino acid ABC transporter permease [Nocardioidaceae bacterium]